jgi:formylglycine-generating enzyme required for sulfatase activity
MQQFKSICGAVAAICLVFAISYFSTANAQVVIVPNKLRSPKPAVKSKPKSKPRTAVSSATSPQPDAAEQPVVEAAPKASARNLEFMIVKPPMPEAMPDAPTGKKALAETSEAAPDKAASGPAAEVKPASEEIAPATNSAEKAGEKMPEIVATNDAGKAGKVTEPRPAEVTAAKPAALGSPLPERLFNYEFDAITSDARGRLTEVRKEIRRYFSEDLPGGIVMEMVEIPGGMFMMGSSELDINQKQKAYARDLGKQLHEKVAERLGSESPQHVVKTPGFYIGKFEVTQSQWRAVASLPKVKLELMSDPSQFKGGNRPVERVTWEEAVEFCERLSRATGRKYRLPSEAEWEFACKSGTNSPFYFGEAITTEWANFDGKRQFLSSPKGDERRQTLPVGSLGVANDFGLYDMHGNVWEWCLDNWHENYVSAPDNGRAWQSGGAAYLKVLRGGGWDSAGVECRSEFRDRLTSTLRMNNTGFRVVVEAAVQP